MGKLRPIPTAKVIRIIEKHGFKKVRSGKHTTFKKTTSSGKVLTTWFHLEMKSLYSLYNTLLNKPKFQERSLNN
jgi:predicted RNA binding protein YcfA (HicA-like mRNA interferase family)